jgi:hypothetical protein
VYAPAVVRVRTAYVRELACLRAQELDALEVLGAVVGPDVETFARFPYQLANVIFFQLRCFHKIGIFSKNTLFFQHFPKNYMHFSIKPPNFNAIFRKTPLNFRHIPEFSHF